MHDLLRLLLPIADAEAPSSSAVKVALITAISLVVAAGISALTVMRSRDQPDSPTTNATEQVWTAFNAELSRRALVAEAMCIDKDRELTTKEHEVTRLRDLCWALGHDPDNDLPGGGGP